ncbi:ABC transporter substrate-binding protein [Paracoccus caeni]|uniref:ABC transporter substrate-binding protein n=1 Tax=Paracoccus caeni TaxID=657651 RepID=A0A934VWD5_9RHOB|nr:ABC transporter substrate-binding protein [Paracoccus caeni]MBK4217936.1 ABC transporter substrate-binding protein [Paracoccus caeni]
MVNQDKRKLRDLTCAAALVVFGAGIAAADTMLGASAPMTGPRALLGHHFQQGVRMAIAEVNAAGGVLGEPVDVIFADDQGDNPNFALNAMSKLKDSDRVPVVLGPHFSVAQLATMKNYCDGTLISITGASGVPVTEQGCEYVFRIRGNDNLQAQALVTYALEHLGVEKIGVLYIHDDFGKGGSERVLAALEAAGVEPVSVASHNPHDTDFSAQLNTLKAAGAELVILWTHDQESALIIRQAQQYNLGMKFAGSTSLSQPTFIELAGPAAEGVISASDFIADNEDADVQAFVAKYRETYNEEPELYAATYYDSLRLAAQAINDAGSLEPAAIRDALSKIEYDGLLADYSCTATGDCNHQTNIVEIRDGQPAMLTVVKFDKSE